MLLLAATVIAWLVSSSFERRRARGRRDVPERLPAVGMPPRLESALRADSPSRRPLITPHGVDLPAAHCWDEIDVLVTIAQIESL